MSGTFTLTGRLLYNDHVTARVSSRVQVSAPIYPDTVDNIVYSGGSSAVTDANGAFSMTLLTEPGLYYTVSSDDGAFVPVTFAAPTAGTVLDITDAILYNPPFDPTTITATALTTRAASLTPKLLTGNSNSARSMFAGAVMLDRPDLGNTVVVGVDQARGVAFGYDVSLKKIYNGRYSNPAQGYAQIATPTGVVPYLDRLNLVRTGPGSDGYYLIWFGADTTTAAVWHLSFDLATLAKLKDLTTDGTSSGSTSPFGTSIAVKSDGSVVLVGEYGDPKISGVQTPHIWRSTDTGATWTAVYTGSGIRHIHAVAFDPNHAGEVYATTGDGDTPAKLLRSTDSGATWAEVSGFGHAYFQGVQISFSSDYIWLAGDGDGVSAIVVDYATKTPKHAARNSHFQIPVPGGAPGDMFYSQAFYGAYDTTTNRYYFVTSGLGDPNINNFGNRHGVFYIDKPGGDVRLITALGNDFIPGPVRFYDDSGRHMLLAGNLELDITDRIATSTQGVSAVTVGASPFTYTNTDQSEEALYIKGGTVSAVTKNGTAIFATTNVTVFLKPGEAVTITYSSAPTAFKDIK